MCRTLHFGCRKMKWFAWCTLWCLTAYFDAVSGGDLCPPSSGDRWRLGETRYYIIHGKERGGFVTQDEAILQCKEHGLQLGVIRNMLTFTVVARELEKIGFEQQWHDTWYWVYAKFDNKTGHFYWNNNTADAVRFTNTLYRPPRPVGIGTHITYKGVYEPEKDLQQCLTLAMPWPWSIKGSSGNSKKRRIYGYHTQFDEVYCGSRKRRHALCESTLSSCDSTNHSPYEINEKQESYFFDGNWIIGNRSHILNWGARTMDESARYCQSLGLQLFVPGKDDSKLIPHLKMWSRGVTVSQFWTQLTFNTVTGQFQDAKGNPVNQTKTIKWSDKDILLSRRSSKSDTAICVALSLSYEFVGQMPCEDPISSNDECSWSFLEFVPANCNNFYSTICVHDDHQKRELQWEKIAKNNMTDVLNDNAVLPFGYEGNRAILRSGVKQTFGNAYCGPNYRMARSHEDTYVGWATQPNGQTLYKYDYSETFWMVDGDMFDKTENSYCTISYVEGNPPKRKFKQVKCTEWHFYICIQSNRRVHRRPQIKFQPPKPMEWREGPQPRTYPLIRLNGEK